MDIEASSREELAARFNPERVGAGMASARRYLELADRASQIPGRKWRPGRQVVESLAQRCGLDAPVSLQAIDYATEFGLIEQRSIDGTWEVRAASPAVREERLRVERHKLETRAADIVPIRREASIAAGNRQMLTACETFGGLMAKRYGVSLPTLEVSGSRVVFLTAGPASLVPKLEGAFRGFSQGLSETARLGIVN